MPELESLTLYIGEKKYIFRKKYDAKVGILFSVKFLKTDKPN